jgi:hypothetical protein
VLILTITLIVFGGLAIFIGWESYHAPTLDTEGCIRAAEREERWYPMKSDHQKFSTFSKRKSG